MTIDHIARSRIASLDGARAIAVGMVVIAHLRGSQTFPPADIFWRVDLGNLGVRVFFVISGFIITTLLLRERQLYQTIDLRLFYLRRFFRILPAFWTYLLFIYAAQLAALPAGTPIDIAKAALFISNYTGTDFSVGHSWSLAVEEQFYWLWPAALAWAGLARSKRAALIALAMAPLFRLACDLGWWPTSPRYAFEAVCDALAVGCLLALLRTALWNVPQYRRLVSSRAWWMPFAAIVGISAFHPPVMLWDAVGITMLNLSVAVALDHVMRFPGDFAGRLLNTRGMVWIGLASYSIYLWQQFWLDQRRTIGFPLNLVAIAICAAASYLVVERPLVSVGHALNARFRRKPQSAEAPTTDKATVGI